MQRTRISPQEEASLRQAAQDLDQALARAAARNLTQPAAGSLVADAYAEGRSEGYAMANLLLISAEDHLRAIFQLLTRGDSLPAFALFTLLRSAAEAVIRAAYLLEPSATVDAYGRALNERLDNLIEQDKLKPDPRHFQQRLQQLEQAANGQGVAVRRSKPKSGGSTEIVGFGEPRRSELDLFKEFLPAGDVAFRYLSAMVHSRPWAQAPRGQSRGPSASLAGAIDVLIELNVEVLVGILDKVITRYLKDVEAWQQANSTLAP